MVVKHDLYGCETYLTLKDEYRLRIFKNKILEINIWAQKG